MQSKLKTRVKDLESRRNIVIQILDKSGYMILALIALWASARFAEFTTQFIALSIILGLKWIFGDRKRVIQIFTQEGGA